MGRPLHYLSILLSMTILAGFGLFAIDEMDGASDETTARIAGDPAADTSVASERQRAEERLAGEADVRVVPAATEQRRERRNSSAREAIDDANDALLAPFEGLVDSSDEAWVRRGVPALMGLLLYGFLLSFGARFTTTRG